MARRTGARGWSEEDSADNRVYRRTMPTSGEGGTAANGRGYAAAAASAVLCQLT